MILLHSEEGFLSSCFFLHFLYNCYRHQDSTRVTLHVSLFKMVFMYLILEGNPSVYTTESQFSQIGLSSRWVGMLPTGDANINPLKPEP